MKKFLFFSLLTILAILNFNCAPQISRYYQASFADGDTLVCRVGNVLFSEEAGKKQFTNTGYRYDMEYAGYSQSTAHLVYKEYSIDDNSAYIRPGFTQYYYYQIDKDSLISFRKYDFKVIEASSRQFVCVANDRSKKSPIDIAPIRQENKPIKYVDLKDLKDEYKISLLSDSSAVLFNGVLSVKHKNGYSLRSVEFQGDAKVINASGERVFVVPVKKGDTMNYSVRVSGSILYSLNVIVGKNDISLSFRRM